MKTGQENLLFYTMNLHDNKTIFKGQSKRVNQEKKSVPHQELNQLAP